MADIYIVGIGYAEGNTIEYICSDYQTAEYLWNKVRIDRMTDYEELYVLTEGRHARLVRVMADLSETDPDKMEESVGMPYLKKMHLTTATEIAPKPRCPYFKENPSDEGCSRYGRSSDCGKLDWMYCPQFPESFFR